jgi:glycosyltransferase involved in cell wall biosynthesis
MHFHLRPGGVTTVIADEAAALPGSIVLAGEPPGDGWPAALAPAVRVVRGIGYAADGQVAGPRDVAAEALEVMREEWGKPADIVHVHNATLNKNPSLPGVLRLLQEAGCRLLVQVHDFAEDGRPTALYPAGTEYPGGCHYAVINSRDHAALVAAGLQPDSVHLLPNTVRQLAATAPRGGPRRGADPPRLLYPVRGIRRKNIGEAILLSAVLPGSLAITLPPRDPADLLRYDAWRSFSREQGLPVVFDAGRERPLGDLLGDADGALSTSLNEGFGFALLEPWTAGVPVAGRRIEHVCADFEEAGVRFPGLYRSLPVDVDLFDAAAFRERWEAALGDSFAAFGRPLVAEARARAAAALAEGGVVDFGALDETAQREIISRACADAHARRRLDSPAMEGLRRALHEPGAGLVEKNRAAIADAWGAPRISRRLFQVYGEVRGRAVKHHPDRDALLDFFLDPARFRMLEQRP